MSFRHAEPTEKTNEQSGGTPGPGLVWSGQPPHPNMRTYQTQALAHALKLGSSPDPSDPHDSLMSQASAHV